MAVNGKVQTLESKKKVDFDDVVEVKDNNDTDPTIKSESTTVQTGVFHDTKGNAIALDKYLEKNAAYAEITTDADGNLTKVTFLDTKNGNVDENVLKGNYYTVSRNVLTENKTKSFNYVDTTAYYAGEKKLYSVDRMPIANAGIADEAAYYTISARPTRADGEYKNTQMVVSAGFDGTPKIEASDKASMLTASIDNRYDSDTYYVADIAFNGDGDIVAMYNFTDDMGETEAKDTILIGSFGNNKDQNNSTIKAGEADQTIKVTVPNGQTLTEGKIVVKDASGKEVSDPSVAWSSHDLKLSATRAAAAGTYTVEVYGHTQGTTDVVVASFKFTVEAADALNVNSVKPMADATTEAVGGSVQDASGATFFTLADGNNPVTNVSGITFKDAQGFDVAGITVAAGNNGVYKATGLAAGKTYTVLVNGKEVGKLDVIANDGASVKLGGAASKSISDVTILDTVNEEYSLDLAGVPANAKIVVTENTINQGTDTTSATKDGITVEVKDGKVTVKGTPTTDTTKDTFKVGYYDGAKAVEASIDVTPKQLTATEITLTAPQTMEEGNESVILTLNYKGQAMTKAQVEALKLNGATITGGSKTVNNVTVNENGTVTLAWTGADTTQITQIDLQSNEGGTMVASTFSYDSLTIDQHA